MRCSHLAITGLATLMVLSSAQAQYHKYDTWVNNYTVQALLGAGRYENLKFDAPDSGAEPVEVDLSVIPQLGGAWTTMPNGQRFQYGLECSFLLGFRLDSVNYASAGGNGLYISLSTSMWMFDLAGGVYASVFVDKGQKVRIYGGAGPLMTYADYKTDQDFSNDEPNQSTHESAFGLGVYARTGFEFRIHQRGMLGLGARGTWSSVDFSNIGGSSELVGIAAFATYTAGF